MVFIIFSLAYLYWNFNLITDYPILSNFIRSYPPYQFHQRIQQAASHATSQRQLTSPIASHPTNNSCYHNHLTNHSAKISKDN
jgi:hypothetical protein